MCLSRVGRKPGIDDFLWKLYGTAWVTGKQLVCYGDIFPVGTDYTAVYLYAISFDVEPAQSFMNCLYPADEQ